MVLPAKGFRILASSFAIPKFYGLTKIHKAGVPLRPIVSSRGSVSYNIAKKTQKESFISHINSIDEDIQFTMEDSREDGSIPFLDTLVTPCPDGSLSTRVYRKPTHTDLYLQWDSHHTIAAKYSVVSTLHHRAKAVSSTQQLLE